MTKMEKLALVATLLECALIGYFKYKVTKVIEKNAKCYFEEIANEQIARQSQKFYENATESNKA